MESGFFFFPVFNSRFQDFPFYFNFFLPHSPFSYLCLKRIASGILGSHRKLTQMWQIKDLYYCVPSLSQFAFPQENTNYWLCWAVCVCTSASILGVYACTFTSGCFKGFPVGFPPLWMAGQAINLHQAHHRTSPRRTLSFPSSRLPAPALWGYSSKCSTFSSCVILVRECFLWLQTNTNIQGECCLLRSYFLHLHDIKILSSMSNGNVCMGMCVWERQRQTAIAWPI